MTFALIICTYVPSFQVGQFYQLLLSDLWLLGLHRFLGNLQNLWYPVWQEGREGEERRGREEEGREGRRKEKEGGRVGGRGRKGERFEEELYRFLQDRVLHLYSLLALPPLVSIVPCESNFSFLSLSRKRGECMDRIWSLVARYNQVIMLTFVPVIPLVPVRPRLPLSPIMPCSHMTLYVHEVQ